MNLNFSDEQNLLREQIQKFCNSDYDFYDREDFINTEAGFDPEKWKLFAEQGWLAMPFSSESGGFSGFCNLAKFCYPAIYFFALVLVVHILIYINYELSATLK